MDSYFQPDNLEQIALEAYESGDDDLLNGLAIVGAGAATAVGGELARRKYGGFGNMAKDLNQAARVVTGRSAYDKDIENFQRHEKGKRGKAINNGVISIDGEDVTVPARSIGDYATRTTERPTDPAARVRWSAPSPNRPDILNLGDTYTGSARPLTEMAIAARDAFNPSSEDFLSLKREFRQNQGQSAEGPRTDTVFSRIPGLDGARDLLGDLPGGFSPEEQQFRKDTGLALMKGSIPQRIGSAIGRLGSDFVNNGARSLWWLLNAPQAVVDIASEGITGGLNREGLYGQDIVTHDEARARGWVDPNGKPLNNSVNRITEDSVADPYFKQRIKDLKSTINVDSNSREPGERIRKNIYSRRRVGNNLSTLLALPAAIGINAGLGLNNPFGGGEGRKAILPSEEDPTKTSNVIGEVAAKYILGRQGELLPWDEYKKVRPDVTRDEYMAYKAYRWDKGIDLNLFDDGRFNAPLGIFKINTEGLNGIEAQFLGKDMALNTTIVPTAVAIAGAGLGAALGRYGAFNQEGINERVNRAQFLKDQLIANQASGDKTKMLPEDQFKKRVLGQEAALRGQEFAQSVVNVGNSAANLGNRVIDMLPGSNAMHSALGKMRIGRRNPVLTSLIGGTGALAATSVIGNEIERRRREEKLNQQQIEIV